MGLRTIAWVNNSIRIIDQTRLPGELKYLYLRNVRELWQAIKELKVRGAPALGAASALGSYLGVKGLETPDKRTFLRRLEQVMRYLASSRPTARNLFWGLERVREKALLESNRTPAAIKRAILAEAVAIMEEDRASCRRIGCFGSRLIPRGSSVLTICNAGLLATIDYGTALAALYRAREEGKAFKVYACETRPLLQGARLTTWELKRKGIDVTLICDSMAATLMAQGKIDLVITGADRITANGDAANKIGTYSLAVLARHHHIPFYVAAPGSTFDVKLSSGSDIPIEQRDATEVTTLFFKKPVAARGVKVFNPAFDVTPQALITAFITDKGIIEPPYSKRLKKIFGRDACN